MDCPTTNVRATMIRFCRLVLGLLLLFIMSVSIARVVGQVQSSQLALLFANPNGSACQHPCLFGVQPGQTSYAQAVALLRTHPFTHSMRSNGIRNMFSGSLLSVILALDADEQVSSITLVIDSDTAAVANWASLGQ